MKSSQLLAPVAALVILCCGVPTVRADNPDAEGVRAVQSGLSIVESGADAAHRVYTLQADRVDVAELLRAFFKKAGQEAAIDRDVTGQITLTIRDKSFREALQWIVQVTRPFIKVTALNGVYHVSLDPAAQAAQDARVRADAVRNAMRPGGVPSVVPLPGGPSGGSPFAGPHIGGIGGIGWPAGIPNDRPVSISVPPNHPIPLADAVARLSAQARFPISLDPQVPRELNFTGIITEAPLPLVLQTIASTSGLKLVANGRQAVLYPTDQLRILVNDVLLNQYPAAPCVRCGQMVSSAWSFCPFCGQPTPRGLQSGRAPATTRRH